MRPHKSIPLKVMLVDEDPDRAADLRAALIANGCEVISRLASPLVSVVSGCFLVGGLTMGPVCFLAAWRWSCRILFVVPATTLIVGAMLAGWESLP